MVVIQIFYDGKAGELLAPKKGLSKVLESMKFSRLPFAVKRKRTSTQFIPPLTPSGESTPMSLGPPSPTSVPPTPPLTLSRESTPMTSSCPSPASEVAGHHWVSTGSSEISPLSSTPDVSLACAASEEQDMLEEIVDPHHHPEVNGPRKLFTVLGMVKKFFQRERKSTNTRSLFRSPRRIRQTYEHAEAPLDHPEASESTMPFSHLLRSFVPAPSATMVDVNVDQFAIVKYLASGATGTVFEAEDNVSHSRVALKVIKKSLLHDGEDRNVIREQQAFVQNVGNSHAIQLYASFHDTANFYMVMPLQSGGDLHQRIVSMRNLPLDLARFYAAELMVGLYDLHSRGILHRDIKPSNLLIDNRGHLLISDFGLSHVFPVNASGAPPPYCSGLTRHLSGAPYVARGLCGTVDYMAPEIFLEGQYGFGVDYWAAGITLFQMLVGKVPWFSPDEVRMAEKICYSPLPSGNIYPHAHTLLLRMLEKEPKDRAAYEDMVTHPFFDGIDWQAIQNGMAQPPLRQKLDKKFQYVPQEGQLDLRRGEGYATGLDPYPTFSWVSPSLRVQRGRITIRKAASSVVRRICSWIEATADGVKRIPSMLKGAERTGQFPLAFVFPDCPSWLSTDDIPPDCSSSVFTDESEGISCSYHSSASSIASIYP